MILSYAISMLFLSPIVVIPSIAFIRPIARWFKSAVSRGFNSPFKQYRERPGQAAAAAAANEDKKVKSKLKGAGVNNEYENFSPGSFSEWFFKILEV